MTTFTPRSFLEITEHFYAMTAAEMKHHAADDFNQLRRKTPVRGAQLEFIDDLITFLNKATVTVKGNPTALFNDETKQLILSGALLEIKRQIAASYSYFRSPTNSYVYSQIDKVLGASVKNVLDNNTVVNATHSFATFRLTAGFRLLMEQLTSASLLKFGPLLQSPVKKSELSTAVAALKLIPAESKKHVDVKDKALDNTHVRYVDGQYEDNEYTKDYIEADNNLDEETKKLRIAQYKACLHVHTPVMDAINHFDKSTLHAPKVIEAKPCISNNCAAMFDRSRLRPAKLIAAAPEAHDTVRRRRHQ